jgi:transcriptional antiterminator RfaH
VTVAVRHAAIAWYAVHTRPQAEARALENLLLQGYQAYLPRYRAQIRHARQRRTEWRPLFPRYLFAGVDRAVMRWRPILSTIGVSDVVRAGEEPAPVAPEIIENLREQERAGGFERLARRHPVQLGELVRISAGALEDLVGRLVELRDQDRVVVLLELLGRKVRAQLDRDAVEAA